MTNDQRLLEICKQRATIIINNPDVFSSMSSITDHTELTEILYGIELEHQHRNEKEDATREYNDPIVAIEEVEEEESPLLDLTVTGNNLFYANGVLTKNSHGVSMTADWMGAMISTAELEAMDQMTFKQLKNRFGSLTPTAWRIGMQRHKFKMYDVDDIDKAISNNEEPEEESHGLGLIT